MKFTKFGKALLMGALSAGVMISITSCIQSYSVGYLYVTGTVTAQTSGNGIVSGFSIDHNTGKLTAIHGLPVSSGGANPVRAVLLTGSRFLYVLNRGANSTGGDCTTANPCANANITEFAVGADGILSAQGTFYTQGINPFRLFADGSGNYLYALDHDSIGQDGQNPATPQNPNTSCGLALGNGSNGKPLTVCGDITTFKIDSTTGRLTLLQNAQVTAANGTPLAYFPVPANPVDFVFAQGSILTLSGSAATNYPYTGGSSIFPYSYNGSTGQLTISQNSPQVLGIGAGTALSYSGSYLYVLDNEPLTVNGITAPSQILPYQVSTGGSLAAQTGGPVQDDVTLSNPIAMLVESKGKWAYVANQGNNTGTSGTAQSGIAGYVLDPSTKVLTTLPGEPFGSGAAPQCIVEDPSNQFIYEANFNDSTVTGRLVDQNSGELNNLAGGSSFPLTGPPTYCLMDGRTN
jgi:hypothetical protein